MKIISRFNDYCDRAMAHGSDPSRVFLREPESRKIKLDLGRNSGPGITADRLTGRPGSHPKARIQQTRLAERRYQKALTH
jgi:hypothetical protein